MLMKEKPKVVNSIRQAQASEPFDNQRFLNHWILGWFVIQSMLTPISGKNKIVEPILNILLLFFNIKKSLLYRNVRKGGESTKKNMKERSRKL